MTDNSKIAFGCVFGHDLSKELKLDAASVKERVEAALDAKEVCQDCKDILVCHYCKRGPLLDKITHLNELIREAKEALASIVDNRGFPHGDFAECIDMDLKDAVTLVNMARETLAKLRKETT